AMRRVRGIERAAQQADHLAGTGIGGARLEAAEARGNGKAHASNGARPRQFDGAHNSSVGRLGGGRAPALSKEQRSPTVRAGPFYCLNRAERENEEALTTGGFSACCGWGSSR